MKHYDNEMTECAARDFLCRATLEGRSEDCNPCPTLSRRFGNLVTIYGMSNRIAYYRVLKHTCGEERVQLLTSPSEEQLERLALTKGIQHRSCPEAR